MDKSEITHSKGGTVYSGPDAVRYFGAMQLKLAIRLYRKTKIIPTRGMSISRMLKLAKPFTGKRYANSAAGWEKCEADLQVWCDTMRAALPETREGE